MFNVRQRLHLPSGASSTYYSRAEPDAIRARIMGVAETAFPGRMGGSVRRRLELWRVHFGRRRSYWKWRVQRW